jgi:16S rRNA (uracil1498-N3)-methyltransferase
MSIIRLWCDTALQVGQIIELAAPASHYLITVRRLNIGASLVVFNGRGGEYLAELTHCCRNKSQLNITKYLAVRREPATNIELVQAMVRGDKMAFIIQKAVELGVKKITPILTERNAALKLDAKQSANKQQHWQAIAISASEQSGRTIVPTIGVPITLSAWLGSFTGCGIVLDPYSNTKVAQLATMAPYNYMAVVIGPEGGLSGTETALLLAHNFLALNLGPRVLRTETASLVALTLVQHYFGDIH